MGALSGGAGGGYGLDVDGGSTRLTERNPPLACVIPGFADLFDPSTHGSPTTNWDPSTRGA